MKIEDDINILRALRLPFKRRVIELTLHIKREHPALTDEELLAQVFPPETKPTRQENWQRRAFPQHRDYPRERRFHP